MKTLRNLLQATFSAPRNAPRDQHRAARQEAKRLAALHSICIEKLPGGGMNVWPPAGFVEDPCEGDHYAHNWGDALEQVRMYLPPAVP
ncbi:hypothetical protein HLB44_31005 [Aquincola sp. S2]|uniref:Uncharacterized protein n=1 Tax=Pseudaquabacterium terrae TaxID=2732868 RepID=A0ABX2ESL2_9BURK|nr:hypothetical protein [Aquabacterium terrae]NRF71424.1 hypothetical protein [Aquabacterium terrae]